MLFKLLISLCLLLLLVWDRPDICGFDQTDVADETDADKILWSSLTYKANSFMGKVTTVVRLATLPAETATELLIDVPQGEVSQASNPDLVTITVHSDINPLIGSRLVLSSRAWYDSGYTQVLQRERMRLGSNKWQKIYRFTDQGVFRLKIKPQDSKENKLSPEQWSQLREAFYAYEYEGLSCATVIEPAGLLHLVSDPDFLLQKRPVSLCVFNKKQLHRVKVWVDGSRQLKVDYLKKLPNGQTRREEKSDVIKVSFQPRAMIPEDKTSEEFSFLELKGDFEIYVDKASRIPVQVSGKISPIGKVDIKLHEVVF